MSALAFELPEALEAREPPEAKGLARHEIRLLVSSRADQSIRHTRFDALPGLLDAGDLLVVNNSATIPAAIAGQTEDGPVRVHFATRAPRLGQEWRVVELRTGDGSRPMRGQAGQTVTLEGGAALQIVAPYASGARLLLARFDGPVAVQEHLERFGEPIRYGYVNERWPLDVYQNAYATEPGSAEMPSAGRPLTGEVIAHAAGRGIAVVPITLHTGVSSPEQHEGPFPEYFEVPEASARLINATRKWGGRVIAVGTTVVRALETVSHPEGAVRGAKGWTTLVIGPERGLWSVDGLITGWHEPDASHLQMLEAAAGRELLVRSYREALDAGYLWHEFGDSHLIL